MSTFEFKLPDIGEGVVEGEITEWHVKVGDTVKEDDPLLEVMTDKATVIIPSPRDGTILETKGEVGEIIDVGAVVVVIQPEGAEAPAEAAEEAAEVAAPVAAAANGGNGATAQAANNNHRKGKVLATPAVRRMAREMGVDLTSVPATGKGGRVLKTDLEAFVEGDAAPTSTEPAAVAAQPAYGGNGAAAANGGNGHKTPAPTGDVERIPYRGLRKAIGDKMAQSLFTATHFTYVEEVDMTNLVAYRAQIKDEYKESHGVSFTYLPFIVKAVVAGLRQFPTLNATLDEEAGEILVKRSYNIGVAAATDRGLIVPVVKDADQKSFLQLATEIQGLASRARDGKSTMEDLQGGTFTISSLGKDGGLFATPILNHPEVGIIGIHKIKRMPVVQDDDSIAIRHMMNLSCSFDHRVIDGHVGAAFTNAVARFLENPNRLLLGG